MVSVKGRILMRTGVGKRPLDRRLLGPGKNLTRRRISLRLTAALAVLLATAGVAAWSAARPVSAATSLKSLAEAKGRYFGTAMTQNMLCNSTVTTLVTQQFDMVTRATR